MQLIKMRYFFLVLFFSLIKHLNLAQNKSSVSFINPRVVVVGTDTLPLAKLTEAQRQLVNDAKKDIAEDSYRLALAHVANQQVERASSSLNKALALDDTHARAFLLRASLSADKGQKTAALADFQSAISYDTQLHQAWFGKGLLLMQMDKPQEAQQAFDSALLLKKSADHYFWRGIAQKEQGHYVTALVDFDSALSWQPNREEAIFQQAETLLLKGDTLNALSQWKQLWELQEGDVKTGLKIAAIYIENEQFDEASSILMPIVQQDSSQCQATFLMGQIYWKQGKWQKAIAAFSSAVQCNPNMVFAYHYRAACFYKLEQFQEALTDADKTLTLANDMPEAYLNRGNIREMLRDKEGACEDWQKAQSLGIEAVKPYIEGNCKQ